MTKRIFITVFIGLLFCTKFSAFSQGSNSVIYEIWNWEDLSKVLDNQQIGYSGNSMVGFILMQDLGVPGSNPPNYGMGDSLINSMPAVRNTHPGDKRFGWYGYEGFRGLDQSTPYATYLASNPNANANAAAAYIIYKSLASNYQDSCGWQMTTGEGWIPIGYDASNFFRSTFIGNNKTINGLWANRNTIIGYGLTQGLFGVINGQFGEQISIYNLGVNIDTVIGITGTGFIGGLSGYIVGDVQVVNCYTTGKINQIGVSSSLQVGGLIGSTNGNGNINGNPLSISNCYSACNIAATNTAGGFIGYMETTSIKNCYAAGKITEPSNYNGFVGGFAGAVHQSSTIDTCYAAGEVTGYSVGGFAGYLRAGSTITNCFALNPNINAINSYGRVVDSCYGTVQNSYGLKSMTLNHGKRALTGVYNRDGSDISSCDIINNSTKFVASGWDFTKVWTINYTNYEIVPNFTNLPILSKFKVGVGSDKFLTALQPPHVVACVQAINDTVEAIAGNPKEVDVLNNDCFCCLASAVGLTILDNPLHGTAIVTSDNKIKYTANSDFEGLDSLHYVINCDDVLDTATVYFNVIRFQFVSHQYIACPKSPVKMQIMAKTGFTFYWYNTQTGGSPFRGPSDTATITKDTSDLQIYWVEPHRGATIFARQMITVVKSESCGGPEIGCSASGKLLFKEDFGGNNTADPANSSTSLPAGTIASVYQFQTVQTNGSKPTWYWLTKRWAQTTPAVWQRYFGDHTHSVDTLDKGYFLLVDADTAPGMFYKKTLTGFCPGVKTFYFTAWMVNMVNSSAAQTDDPSLRFDLEDQNGNILATYYTGFIPRDANGNTGASLTVPNKQVKWRQYGFGFEVPDSTNDVTLKIYNNTRGGNGNDLALDDIEVHLCLPSAAVSVKTNCGDTSAVLTAAFIDDGSLTNHGTLPLSAYWIKSDTNDITDTSLWKKVNILGTTTHIGDTTIETVVVPFPANGDTAYYRFVAGGALTVNNPACRVTSDVVAVFEKPLPKFSTRDTAICSSEAVNLYSQVYNLKNVSASDIKFSTDASNFNAGLIANPTSYVASATQKIYINAKNTFCETNDSSFTITVNSHPVVSVASSTICVNAATQLSPSTGGTWTSGNNAIATVTNGGLVTGVSAGNVSFTFTDTATGCSTTTSPMTVNALPIIAIIGSDSICINTTTQLSPTTGGTWTSSNDAIATVTNDGLVTGHAVGSVRFIFQADRTFCTDTTDAVIVGTFPAIDLITALKKNACVNDTIYLSCTSTNGVWSLSNTNAHIDGNATGNTVAIIGSTAGRVYATYTVGTGYCQSKSTYLLRITPATPPEIKIGFER